MAFQHRCQPQGLGQQTKMKLNLKQKHWDLVQEAVGFSSPSQPSNGWLVWHFAKKIIQAFLELVNIVSLDEDITTLLGRAVLPRRPWVSVNWML